jgi:hypothetical protein
VDGLNYFFFLAGAAFLAAGFATAFLAAGFAVVLAFMVLHPSCQMLPLTELFTSNRYRSICNVGRFTFHRKWKFPVTTIDFFDR